MRARSSDHAHKPVPGARPAMGFQALAIEAGPASS